MNGAVNWITFQDNTNCFAPIMEMLSRKWHSAGAPHFSSEFIGGYPFYANPHFNVFYPLYFLWTSAYQTAEQAFLFMHKLVLLHLLILCVNTYILGSALGLRKPICALIAIGFTFSQAIYPTLSHLTITAATAWLPLVLASLCFIFEGYPRAGAITLAISSLLMIGAMPAQVLAITVVVSLCFVIGQLILGKGKLPDKITTLRSYATPYLGLLMGSGVVIALAGPYLYNVHLFHLSSIRWAGAHPPVGPGETVSREILQEYAFDLKELSNLFYLTYFNSVAGHIYTGAMVFLLAIAGACSAVCRRQKSFIVLTVIGVVFLAFCFRPIVVSVNYYLPLINLIREASWFGLVYTLAVFCLAGFGLERIIDNFSGKMNIARMSLLSLAAAALLVISFYFIKQSIRSDLQFSELCWNLLALGLISIPIIAGLVSLPVSSTVNFLAPLLGFAIALYPHHLPKAPRLSDNDIYLPESIEIRAALKHFSEIVPDNVGYRVDVPFGGRIDWAMSALHYGIRTYHGYLTPQVADIFENMYWITSRPMAARIAGMKYRIRAESSKKSESNWQEIGRYRGWLFEEDPEAFPRIFAAHRIAGTYDSEDAQTYWVSVERSRPSPNAVMIPSLAVQNVMQFLVNRSTVVGTPAAGSQVSILSNSDCCIETKCEFLTPGVLVLNEYKSKLWKASLNGKDVQSIEVNHTQVGALVPAGESFVTFKYSPPARLSLRFLGLVITIISMVLLQRIGSLAEREKPNL